MIKVMKEEEPKSFLETLWLWGNQNASHLIRCSIAHPPPPYPAPPIDEFSMSPNEEVNDSHDPQV